MNGANGAGGTSSSDSSSTTGDGAMSEKPKPKLIGVRDGVENGDDSELEEASENVELILGVRRNEDRP